MQTNNLDESLKNSFSRGLIDADLIASAKKKQFKCLEKNEQLTYDQLVDYIEGKVQTKKHMDTIDTSSSIDYSTDQNPNHAQRSYQDRRRQKDQSHSQHQSKQYLPQHYQAP